jgi:nitroreductase
MDFLQLAKTRYSSRKYKQMNVEEVKLNYVLEAGRISPSAVNYQPRYFIVVRGENVENLRACYTREWFKTAPVYIVVCSDKTKSWKRGDGKSSSDIDAAIAADHITLAATGIGLATCWVCNFNKPELCKVLSLPEHVEPVVVLPIGYPDDQSDPERHKNERKPLSDIVVHEKF